LHIIVILLPRTCASQYVIEFIGDLMFCLYAWFVLVALAIGCNDRSVLLHFGSCTIEASAMV
jgi:hypothetical protein